MGTGLGTTGTITTATTTGTTTAAATIGITGTTGTTSGGRGPAGEAVPSSGRRPPRLGRAPVLPDGWRGRETDHGGS